MRKAKDRAGSVAALISVAVAVVPLVAVVLFVFEKGGSVVSWTFLTTNPPPIVGLGLKGGILSSLLGTLYIVGVTSLMGVPLGILSGIYLSSAGKGAFPQAVRFCCDVIAGIPSILAGVLVATLLVVPTKTNSGLAASLALALLMFPTVTRATEAALSAVPAELKEAALGLGATEWKTVLRVQIPTAASGIVTAVILGIARVAGETAPLLFTIGFLGYPYENSNILHGFMGALPGQIFVDSQSGDTRTAMGAALVLFCLVMFLNLVARALTLRLSIRTRLV